MAIIDKNNFFSINATLVLSTKNDLEQNMN